MFNNSMCTPGDCVQCLDDSDTELVKYGCIYRIIDTRPDDMIGLANIHGYTVWMHKYRFGAPFQYLGSTKLVGEVAELDKVDSFEPEAHTELRLEAIEFPITFHSEGIGHYKFTAPDVGYHIEGDYPTDLSIQHFIEAHNHVHPYCGDYSYVMGE